MTIYDVENMTAAELKANLKSLSAEAMSFPIRELAKRYVRARLDAKMRDETLQKQGECINEFESALPNINHIIADLQDILALERSSHLEDMKGAHEKAAYLQKSLDAANVRIGELSRDIETAKVNHDPHTA